MKVHGKGFRLLSRETFVFQLPFAIFAAIVAAVVSNEKTNTQTHFKVFDFVWATNAACLGLAWRATQHSLDRTAVITLPAVLSVAIYTLWTCLPKVD